MKTFYSFLKTHRQLLGIFLIVTCLFVSNVNFAYAEGDIIDRGIAKVGEWLLGGAATVADKAFYPIAWLFYKLATGVGGIISGLGALMLDLSIQLTVIEMGTLLGPGSELGKNVQALWKTVRDIINILFIFGFIYIGIKTILDSQKSETRRTLGMLIVAALIINFSLYITEVVIDFSNIAATQVYQQIVSGGLSSGATANSNDPMAVGAQSLAGAFWDVAGVSSFFGGEGLPPDLDSGQIIVYSIFMMAFLIIAGSVFLMGALLLVKRFIALTLYLIFSPAMFIGWIFPAFSSRQESWREGFINQAFVAPVFLFMLYLSLTLLQKLRLASGFTGTDFTGLIKGGQMEAGHISVVLFFCMMIGFLYASIQVSEKMSKAGASSMLGFLDTGRSAIQGAVYRNTAGWALNKGVERIDAANRTSEDPNEKSKVKKGFARSLRVLTGGEVGRNAMEKASNAGMGARGRDAIKHDEEARKQRAARGIQIHNIEHALEHGTDIEKEKAMRDASSVQLIEMVHHGQEEIIVKNAGLLSDSQAKALMEDKAVDDALSNKLASERGAQIAAQLIKRNTTTTATPTMGGVISKADTSELKAIGYDELMRDDPTHGVLATKLTAKQIDDWKDLTATEKSEIKRVRNEALEADFGGVGPAGGTNAATFFGNIKSVEERSKLPASILTHPTLAPHLDINTLTKMADHPGLGVAELSAIKKAVMDAHQLPEGTNNTDPAYIEHERFNNFFEKNGAGMRY